MFPVRLFITLLASLLSMISVNLRWRRMMERSVRQRLDKRGLKLSGCWLRVRATCMDNVIRLPRESGTSAFPK